MKIYNFLLVCILTMIFLTGCNGDDLQPEPQVTEKTDTEKADNENEDNQDTLTVAEIFPFEPNIYMKYIGEGNEYAEYDTYVDYIGQDVMQVRSRTAGTTMAFVYTIEDGAVKLVFSKEETYYRYNYTDYRNMEEIIIMEPIREGTSWILEDGKTRSITAVDKEIEVKAGRYSVVEVTTEDENFITRKYYASGIGQIKQEFISKEDTSFIISSELEIADKGVPHKNVVRLFFPDFEKERLVYIDREVELNTNDEIKDIFEQEFKKVPEESNLRYVLSPDTKILSIQLDENMVTVDFSQNLTHEMNAGVMLEGMILKCLTNTFGVYFQKELVTITIDGSPYSSGHIYTKEGEFFTVDIDGIEEF
ncbi:UNVERIFIED_CONTAM: sporulation and spore germination protein [Acetivibrio alkalicellulosi]